MVSETPCLEGYADVGGALISREAAQRTVAEELAHGPLGGMYHRPSLDGHFVLAALWMTGQPLPDRLKGLQCQRVEP